ncbi:MAG: DUF1134 domain-containing protein [Proteobacteria bacterium]|nr:DUF1134 domain-containing protein [Pseudomonadota bacterium]
MSEDLSKTRRSIALGLGATAASSIIPAAAWADDDRDTYSEPEIIRAAENFFGAAAEGLANVIHHIFNDKGRPNGYITGDEGSGAIGVGLRYGGGRLHLKGLGAVTPVYWQGPSIGFDTGGNASKVFTLVYHMRDASRIFQRFPGVDGSAYFVGGFGANYQQSGRIILAPIRAGVGFRLGANIGYLNYSRHRRVLPF